MVAQNGVFGVRKIAGGTLPDPRKPDGKTAGNLMNESIMDSRKRMLHNCRPQRATLYCQPMKKPTVPARRGRARNGALNARRRVLKLECDYLLLLASSAPGGNLRTAALKRLHQVQGVLSRLTLSVLLWVAPQACFWVLSRLEALAGETAFPMC